MLQYTGIRCPYLTHSVSQARAEQWIAERLHWVTGLTQNNIIFWKIGPKTEKLKNMKH